MPDNSSPAVRVARPMILVGGQDQPALSGGLLSLLVAETTQGLYRCEATFGNWGAVSGSVGFLYFDRSLLDFGKPLRVDFSDETLFDGRIMGMEAHFPEGSPPSLTILAEDRFQDLRMTRRTRTFFNVSDADLVRQLAGDHGLNAQVNLSGPTYAVLAQVNQSDLAFLRERARLLEAELWLDGADLHAEPRSAHSQDPLDLEYLGNLREFSVLGDLAGQRTSLVVSGWDPGNKEALKYEADDSVVQSELEGAPSGAGLLRQALGERKETIAHAAPLSSQETQAIAEASMRRLARRFLTGRGVAETDPRLKAGAPVNLKGLGPLFSGKYTLTEVRHRFDGAGGIRTEFTAERAGLGSR